MAVERNRMSPGPLMQGVPLQGMIVMMMLWSMFMMLQSSCEKVEGAAEEEVEELVKSAYKRALIEVKVRNLYPESFDWDAKHNGFLVGSTSQGMLVTVTDDGVVEEFVKDEEYAGAAAIVGVKVDSIHNRVLALVRWSRFGVKDARGPASSALAAYDLDSKKRTLFVTLYENKGEDDADFVQSKIGVANDVAVDYKGNAYVTNSAGNSIWKVTPEGVKSVFVEIPQLPIVVDVEFLKAIACKGIVHHDGFLIVAQTNSGALFRVRLTDKAVETVKIKPGGSLLPEADGVVLRSDGSLVVVSTHTAWLLSSGDYWRSANVLDKVELDVADSAVGGAVKDLRFFTIHLHDADGMGRNAFRIVEIEFPTDQHNNPLWLLLILGIFVLVVLCWRFQINQFNKEYTKKRV